MLNKYKALGLALVAVLAMSALAAPSASAKKFTSADGSTQTVTASDVGTPDVFVVGSSTLTCEGETFTGHLEGKATAQLTFDPNWINCKTEGASSNNVTVTDNNCGIIFKTEVNKETVNGIEIECGVGKVIEVHHYTPGSNHSSSTCTETIGAQVPVNIGGPPTYTNNGSHVDATGEAEVSLQTHGQCSLGFTITQAATYKYSVTAKGNSAAIHVG